MVTVKIRLNKAHADTEGTYPIVFQILHRRRKCIIQTPYRLRPDQFDASGEIVLPGLSGMERSAGINAYLTVEKQKLQWIISTGQAQGRELTVFGIAETYRSYRDCRCLPTFFRRMVAEMIRTDRRGSAGTYKSTLSVLKRFGCPEEMRIADISPDFLKRFMRFMQSERLSPNSVALYMRILHAVYNKAVDMELVDEEKDPFRRVHVRGEKTVKRAVSQDVFGKLTKVDLKDAPALQKARDFFLFSFYARGMAFVDMIFLKQTDIQNGFIVYRRRKTNQQLRIKISVPLQELIDRYRNQSVYVLPVLDNLDARSLYNRYRSALKEYNRRLTQIGSLLGLQMKLTSYVARHSWATIAKCNGIPTSVISEGLGHSNEKTTAIYLDFFEDDVVNQANLLIIALTTQQANPKKPFTVYKNPVPLFCRSTVEAKVMK